MYIIETKIFINRKRHWCAKLTYRQPAQTGVLTDQLCWAIYYIHMSIIPMPIAITIT